MILISWLSCSTDHQQCALVLRRYHLQVIRQLRLYGESGEYPRKWWTLYWNNIFGISITYTKKEMFAGVSDRRCPVVFSPASWSTTSNSWEFSLRKCLKPWVEKTWVIMCDLGSLSSLRFIQVPFFLPIPWVLFVFPCPSVVCGGQWHPEGSAG